MAALIITPGRLTPGGVLNHRQIPERIICVRRRAAWSGIYTLTQLAPYIDVLCADIEVPILRDELPAGMCIGYLPSEAGGDTVELIQSGAVEKINCVFVIYLRPCRKEGAVPILHISQGVIVDDGGIGQPARKVL